MARRLNWHPRDAVSALLAAVNVHSSVYCVSDLRAPWGFQVEDSSVAKFHLVLEGACVLALQSGECVPMESGQLVLLPAGTGHTVRDRPDSTVRLLDTILAEHPLDQDARLSYGGQGPRTRLLCGGFVLSESFSETLHEVLPRVLSLDAGSSRLNRWLEPVLALLRDEAGDTRREPWVCCAHDRHTRGPWPAWRPRWRCRGRCSEHGSAKWWVSHQSAISPESA